MPGVWSSLSARTDGSTERAVEPIRGGVVAVAAEGAGVGAEVRVAVVVVAVRTAATPAAPRRGRSSRSSAYSAPSTSDRWLAIASR